MKNLDWTSIATGLVAGVTAALLSLSANVQSVLSIVLFAASALPILIAGLGWGNASALIAVIAGGCVAAALASSHFALMIVIITLIPAGWLSNLANLARPASRGERARRQDLVRPPCGEPLEPVVGRVLVRLAPGRRAERGVDEPIDRSPGVDDGLADVDQLAG